MDPKGTPPCARLQICGNNIVVKCKWLIIKEIQKVSLCYGALWCTYVVAYVVRNIINRGRY